MRSSSQSRLVEVNRNLRRIIVVLLAIILILTIALVVVSCQKRELKKNAGTTDPNGGTTVTEPGGNETTEPGGQTGEDPNGQTQTDPTPQKRPIKSVTDAEIAALSPAGVTWGPGRQFDENERPIACVDLEKKYDSYNADFVWLEEPYSNKVYLTFDEGYENGYTPAILDTLKAKGVKAVFFCTGDFVRSEAGAPLVQRMIDEGHIIGSHSNRHPNMTKITLEKAREDIAALEALMKDKYNYEMDLFRFPEGEFSEQTLALMQQLGYSSVFWSFAYQDWDPANQWEEQRAKDYILEHVHGGEIMLLHAVSATNANILGEVIDTIRAKGFEIAPYPYH